ncbi:glycosyltransferase involved in cell wall biosynthesis [Rhodobacter viridis]|uniref:Glycosyltransferase involved in cell wall biosynthesis n=1 Tax=Rhodobacter viridis TaxID=1054202 RepID=A0A318U830_9RHOB|nr:glycosyltransferase family 2 protein [Rhodobacter viridis]PYF08129.1 glycosyltransferase involved in cell wall biosynthesis [Rhodobacter viridis]
MDLATDFNLSMPVPEARGPAPVSAPVVSVVVPLHDEAPNLPPLVAGIRAALTGLCAHEILLVDDGSTDDTRAVALDLAAQIPELRVIAHAISAGQSAAVHSGVRAARGALVATLDGDGQNPPENLPQLLAPLLAPESDPQLGLVAGQRVGRQDGLSKRLASRFANTLRQAILHDATRDTGCGLKAFRRAAYLDLPYFDHMHRYLPALFARDGWRVAHVDVSHAPRQHGRSKYTNLARALVGISDLIGVAWLIRRRKRAQPQELPRADRS